MKFQDIFDYEKVKDRLFLRLGPNLSEDDDLIVRCTFMDMAITYSVDVDENQAMIVSKSLLKQWGIDSFRLHYDALYNTMKKAPPVIKPISDILLTTAGNNGNQFYAVTNINSRYGANVILYPGVLMQVACTIGVDDIWLIPSSKHEFLAIKAGMLPVDDMVGMIRMVNDTIVTDEDILSYSLYRYNRETDVLNVEVEVKNE
jgi:hypothetical protein